jgi:site-specific DNA recombinase
MKAVIFTRVSSKDQADGHSIDAQTAKLKTYCLNKGFNATKLYQVTESSTVGERTQFKQMLEYITALYKKDKKRVVLAIDKVDRLMRNFNHYPEINKLIEDGAMEIHIVGDNATLSKESSSTEKAFFNIGVVMSQVYIDAMRDNIKRSRDLQIKNGEYPSCAPIGYKNVRGDRNKADIVLDEERCFLVKRLLQEYSTGAYSLGDLTKMAKKIGLRNKTKGNGLLIKSQIYKMVSNKFYIGIMTINGIERPHGYKRLIDDETFFKCQAVRAKANKTPFKYSAKQFTFRGMITCAKCGCAFSSYEKKGHVYLRPTQSKGDCDCRPMKEEQALQVVKELFQSLYIPPAMLEEMKVHLKALCEGKADYQISESEALTKEFQEIERKKKRLLDLLLDDSIQSITPSMYDKNVQEFLQRQHEITNFLSSQVEADKAFQITLKALLELCSNSYEIFNSSQIDQKRKLMSFVLANLNVKGGILCYTLRKPFDGLVNIAKNEEWCT